MIKQFEIALFKALNGDWNVQEQQQHKSIMCVVHMTRALYSKTSGVIQSLCVKNKPSFKSLFTDVILIVTAAFIESVSRTQGPNRSDLIINNENNLFCLLELEPSEMTIEKSRKIHLLSTLKERTLNGFLRTWGWITTVMTFSFEWNIPVNFYLFILTSSVLTFLCFYCQIFQSDRFSMHYCQMRMSIF